MNYLPRVQYFNFSCQFRLKRNCTASTNQKLVSRIFGGIKHQISVGKHGVCMFIPFEVRYSSRSNSSLFINYYQVCLINIRLFNNLSSDSIISKLNSLSNSSYSCYVGFLLDCQDHQ